jgi:hypothetical protein
MELVLEEDVTGLTVLVLQPPGMVAIQAQAPQRLEEGGVT